MLLLLPGVVMLAVMTAIVFLESGRRKIAVQYAKRVVGRRVYGGQNTHIPLKINTAGGNSPNICLFHNCVSGNNYEFHPRAVGAIHWGHNWPQVRCYIR